MRLSLLEVFKVGLGPSSSHTVGPMKAAAEFRRGLPPQAVSLKAHLYGSLALTGRGHASDRAVLLGWLGYEPDEIDVERVAELLAQVPSSWEVVFHARETLPEHPNGMCFEALDSQGNLCQQQVYYSVGGGQIRRAGQPAPCAREQPTLPFLYTSAAELLQCCQQTGLSIWEIGLANEEARRPGHEVEAWLSRTWEVMKASAERGLRTPGCLPGGLQVQRRAPALAARVRLEEALAPLDQVEAWAMAVSEENAAGGRVVTAPTNGAAGIVPAVALYYDRFVAGSNWQGLRRYFLSAAVLGALYIENTSISGAEVGCQGEVGVACSMAAGGLVAAQGGSCEWVEKAAEMAMEHHLGLTCDPVAGLVQIPCIERNALAATQAVLAARLAMREGAAHRVSLDQVMAAMLQTGRDMSARYKETSQAGLALNVPLC